MTKELSPKDIQKAAIILTGGEILSCRLCENGSLSVVKDTGQKVLFPQSEVLKAFKDASWIHADDNSPATLKNPTEPVPVQKRSHHRKPA